MNKLQIFVFIAFLESVPTFIEMGFVHTLVGSVFVCVCIWDTSAFRGILGKGRCAISKS